jgi:hypothetical protein
MSVRNPTQSKGVFMKETLQEKPVVYYVGVAQFSDWNGDPMQPVAHLQYVLGHPTLGNCRNVRTSVVLHKYFDGTIETRNTIYKPMASEGMGS